MTIEEAIKHAQKQAENQKLGKERREEHAQLVLWLKERNKYLSIFKEIYQWFC
ncbi:MAG: hypothetical protein ACXACY_19670 [Candidatus Hodarchaeales archaeon]|jgi:hypothetical protein